MKSFSKALTGMAVAAAALAMAPAHAVSVNFWSQNATDGSGKTSVFVPSNNQSPLTSGIFVETFDVAGATPGVIVPKISSYNNGCGINSIAYGVDVTVNQGTLGVQKGTNSNGAAPAGDTTCYGFGPGPAPRLDGNNAKVRIDYTNFLATNAPGDSIGYLGLYYGSIDTYNDITFYSSGTTKVAGTGILADGVITGSEILAIMGGTSGNRTADGSNVYVNLFFGPGEMFSAFEFSTRGIAFEVDNIVAGLASKNVPEPASLALMGLGLVGLAAARRRKQAK